MDKALEETLLQAANLERNRCVLRHCEPTFPEALPDPHWNMPHALSPVEVKTLLRWVKQLVSKSVDARRPSRLASRIGTCSCLGASKDTEYWLRTLRLEALAEPGPWLATWSTRSTCDLAGTALWSRKRNLVENPETLSCLDRRAGSNIDVKAFSQKGFKIL